MHWIYLSPHLDDVALSVGGLLWEQVKAGKSVKILTIFAGDPAPGPFSAFAESLHARWAVDPEVAIAARRAEDVEACKILGVDYQHLSISDCIYRTAEHSRKHLYASEESLFGDVHPAEVTLIENLSHMLEQGIMETSQLVCPLALGNHVDHQLVRTAAERLELDLLYYADYPYLLDAPGWEVAQSNAVTYPITEKGIVVWQNSVAAYFSQISTFWRNTSEMALAIQAYAQKMGGVKLWKKPEHMF